MRSQHPVSNPELCMEIITLKTLTFIIFRRVKCCASLTSIIEKACNYDDYIVVISCSSSVDFYATVVDNRLIVLFLSFLVNTIVHKKNLFFLFPCLLTCFLRFLSNLDALLSPHIAYMHYCICHSQQVFQFDVVRETLKN